MARHFDQCRQRSQATSAGGFKLSFHPFYPQSLHRKSKMRKAPWSRWKNETKGLRETSSVSKIVRRSSTRFVSFSQLKCLLMHSSRSLCWKSSSLSRNIEKFAMHTMRPKPGRGPYMLKFRDWRRGTPLLIIFSSKSFDLLRASSNHPHFCRNYEAKYKEAEAKRNTLKHATQAKFKSLKDRNEASDKLVSYRPISLFFLEGKDVESALLRKPKPPKSSKNSRTWEELRKIAPKRSRIQRRKFRGRRSRCLNPRLRTCLLTRP